MAEEKHEERAHQLYNEKSEAACELIDVKTKYEQGCVFAMSETRQPFMLHAARSIAGRQPSVESPQRTQIEK